MKKLFLWAALAMTGFAFYSCDDVVDNPAQDSSSKWNYSVSVTFADFDFGGLTDAESNPYAYEAPKTLYVFNEDMQAMGTISTDVAPAAGGTATYSGTLTGSIGNNLIITTANNNSFAKQDGTMESAIKYGIVQADTVPIKIYNAMSEKISTGAAKMNNNVSIVALNLGNYASSDDKVIKFSTDDLDIPGIDDTSFTITLNEDVYATGTFYVALATKSNDEFDLQVNIDATDRGYELIGTLEEAAITIGALTYLGTIYMNPSTVDLTKLWAAYKEAHEDAKFTSFTSNFKGTIITQSGSEAVPVRLIIYKDVTLKNINTFIEEGAPNEANTAIYSYNYYGDGIYITLEGINNINTEKYYGLYFEEGTITLTGDGSLNITSYGNAINGNNYYNPWDYQGQDRYSALRIDKGVNVSVKSTNSTGIYIPSNDTLIVRDNAKLEVEGGESCYAFSTEDAVVELGEGATIIAKAGKKGRGINSGAEWNIADGAKIFAYGGKEGYGMDIWGDGTNKIKIGKNVEIVAQGAPTINEDAIGIGMQIGNCEVTIDEGTTIKATGADRNGLILYSTTIDIAEGATIEAADAFENAIDVESWGATGIVTIKGKGAIKAETAGKNGIINWANLNLNGAVITAKGAAGKPAILNNGTLAIGSDVISVTATAGTGSTVCIADANGEEAKLEDIVADKTKFNDTTADGVRTITPKPAEE